MTYNQFWVGMDTKTACDVIGCPYRYGLGDHDHPVVGCDVVDGWCAAHGVKADLGHNLDIYGDTRPRWERPRSIEYVTYGPCRLCKRDCDSSSVNVAWPDGSVAPVCAICWEKRDDRDPARYDRGRSDA